MTVPLARLANPSRMAWTVLTDAWRPSPPVDYEAWAIRNITFTERESNFPGPYNPDLFPYFSEILAALSPDDPCRIVTVTKSAQIGGTVLANIFTLGSLDLDPCDFLYVHPTEENARRWSKMKLVPMIRESPRLRDIFPDKSRDASDSVLYKERVDGRGSIQITGANSPSSLSQVSMRRQVQDDLAKWATDRDAGDPEILADSRSRAFEFAKVFKVSTPLIQPGCRITRNFEAGSQESLQLPCPHCGYYQTLEPENFIANVDDDHPERSCFTCVECGVEIREHHRPEMLRRGRWVAKNPSAKREHRSFTIWSAYSRLQSFERIAREWIAARGLPDREKGVYNDTFGKVYEVKGEAPPWQDLRDRADTVGHRRGSIPEPGIVVSIGVDVQDGWLAWHAVAWSRDGRRYVIDYAHIEGHIDDASTHRLLDQLLASTWRHESGRMLGVDMLAIDGNAWTELVWNWVKRHPASRVIMVRGVAGDRVPLIEQVRKERSRNGKPLRYSKRFFNFASWILKWSLYRNLVKADPLAVGWVGLPSGMSEDYFKELTSERRIEKKNSKGFVEYEWVKDRDQRNEALDTMVQAEAAAVRYGIRDMSPGRWDALTAERATPLPERQLDLEDALLGVSPAKPGPAVQAVKPGPPDAKRAGGARSLGSLLNGGRR